jgi:chromosome partitioning protein
MARIVVFNQKGGVGKTTTTLNIAALLTRRGRAPLVIDLDPQGHLTSISGATVPSVDDSLYAYFQETRMLADLVRPGTGGWPVIPSHLDLSKVDTQYGKGPQALNLLNSGIARENLDAGRHILMDACPMLGVLSLNGIFASDRVIIPVSADYLAIKGALQIERTLRALERVIKQPPLRRYVITRFDGRRKMSWDIDKQLRDHFGEQLCESRIAESVSVAESPAYNRDVFAHAADSRGARDYTALVDELEAVGFIG